MAAVPTRHQSLQGAAWSRDRCASVGQAATNSQSSHLTAAGCTPPQGHAPEGAPVPAARTPVLNSWCSSRVVLPWATFTGSCSNSKDCSTSTAATTQQDEANNGTLNPRPQRYIHALAISPLGRPPWVGLVLPPKHKWMQPIVSICKHSQSIHVS